MVTMIVLLFVILAIGAGVNIMVLSWCLSCIGTESSSKQSDVSKRS